jgi:hypothetical protein
MDSIKAAAMTTPQVPVTPAKLEKKEAEGQPVMDTVEKGPENAGFFTKMKGLVSSGVDTKEEAYRSSDVSIAEKYRCELIGGGVGFVAAGVIGAVVAHSSAMADVNKLPVESVSLNWKEPIMQDKNLGQIPSNYYQPNNIWGWVNDNNGKVDVVRQAPALDPSGQPYLQPRSHTFTDHGKPVVRWEDQTIRDPQLKGWSESTIPDTEQVLVGHHTERVEVGTDSNGRAIYENRQVDDYETRTKGYQHSFSPDIDYRNLGTWQKPEVTFETGVNVGLRTFGGFLIGAATGAVGIALATTAAKRVIAKMQEKQASEAKG